MKKFYLITFLFVVCRLDLKTQTTFPSNGAPHRTHTVYAIINAKIQTNPETLLNKGIILVQDGKIKEVGEKVSIPKNAVIYDLKGKYVYPSFIDLYSDYGITQVKYEGKSRPGPQMESSVKGAFGWNQAIRSNIEAHKLFVHNRDKADELKRNGFGSVVSSSKDGIVRGSAVFVLLNNSKEQESVITDKVAGMYSFQKGSSTQDYPSSLTGAIALIRQTYYDAQWYAQNKNKTEYNISLEEFNKLQKLPSVFEAGDKYNALRAAKIGKEFNVTYLIKGGGNEYQRVSDIKASGLKFILPMDFPDAYDVEDPYEAETLTLADLKHWELAPANAAILEKHNVEFCFTSYDLKDKNLFLKNLRKAVQHGLSEKTALTALTLNPAKFINEVDKIGMIKKGYYANFFVSDRPIFNEDASILQHWVAGEPDVYTDIDMPDLRGNYKLTMASKTYKVKISGESAKPKAQVTIDTTKKNLNFSFLNNLFSFSFMPDSNSVMRGSGLYNKEKKSVDGKGQSPDGSWFEFKLVFESATDTSDKKPSPVKSEPLLGKIIYPFNAYGQAIPEGKGTFRESWEKFRNRYSAILIKDAMVWTNTSDSVLKEYDVYIVKGKIVRIAPEIQVPADAFAKVINAKGLHLTPGIIDEHSHIAISAGVNEGTKASSAEVRMGDVINPEDINIYRLLSGGVTSSQLLHGSANPIGGQSTLIKLRWGLGPEEMKFENADPFIKFALGENVKQSNWGDLNSIRFPQSRMGVEQVYTDHFIRAKEYDKQINVYMALPAKTKGAPPRRDLELEAIAEILNKKRFITCHSYVQSEINMLMHVADSFGFKINTFTHILEGYKLADKMKAHGVNASTFSDWWAYKNEVLDAIPYNAAILTRVGVNTAINSDDAEMARRLNHEAAKCIKYGGLSETEALKLVTLNPAKMLHVDDRVGSIQVGKTADLVLWTDNPLSVYAKADKTIIDGIIYFDREEDAILRAELKDERTRIINKLLLEKQKGTKTIKPQAKRQKLYHCESMEGENDDLTSHR